MHIYLQIRSSHCRRRVHRASTGRQCTFFNFFSRRLQSPIGGACTITGDRNGYACVCMSEGKTSTTVMKHAATVRAKSILHLTLT